MLDAPAEAAGLVPPRLAAAAAAKAAGGFLGRTAFSTPVLLLGFGDSRESSFSLELSAESRKATFPGAVSDAFWKLVRGLRLLADGEAVPCLL